ncbi:MAG: hypothetical protein IPH54_04410 [Rhodoferax sp.]|nr:hypothetical protein [Rhodoferax sp.]
MNTFSILNTKTAKCGLGLTLVAALVACGGGSDTVPVTLAVASSNITAGAVNNTTAEKTATASRAGGGCSNPSDLSCGFAGVDATGAPVAVTESTTVAFKANAADATKPAFEVASASGKASGSTTLGSCTFTITTSTYPASSPFALGKTIKIDPCTVKIDTAGKTANIPNSVPVAITFGTRTVTTTQQVTVSSSGSVIIGNRTLPQDIKVTLTTGTSS